MHCGVWDSGGMRICEMGKKTELGLEKNYCVARLFKLAKDYLVFKFHISGNHSDLGLPGQLFSLVAADIED